MRKVFLPSLRCMSLGVCEEQVEDVTIIERDPGSSIAEDSDDPAREIIGARDAQGGEADSSLQLTRPLPLVRDSVLYATASSEEAKSCLRPDWGTAA